MLNINKVTFQFHNVSILICFDIFKNLAHSSSSLSFSSRGKASFFRYRQKWQNLILWSRCVHLWIVKVFPSNLWFYNLRSHVSCCFFIFKYFNYVDNFCFNCFNVMTVHIFGKLLNSLHHQYYDVFADNWYIFAKLSRIFVHFYFLQFSLHVLVNFMRNRIFWHEE